MSQIQFIGTDPSAICSLGPRPQLLTGLFRVLLTQHFQPGQIEDPALQGLVWQEGTEGNILIESIYRWTPTITQRRPGIVIRRNAYSNQRVSFDDRHLASPTDRFGLTTHTTLWVGSHTLFCIGGSGAQAEILATEVQRELTEFGPLIRKTMLLKRFAVTDVAEVHELEEASENHFVPVNASYAYEENWQIREQAPRLKRILLSSLLDV